MTVVFSNKSTVIATSESLSSNTCSISKIKHTAYKKYSSIELRDAVLGYVFDKHKTNLQTFCQNCVVPRTTIQKYMYLIPELINIRNNGGYNLQQAEYLFDSYMREKTRKIKTQLDKVHSGNCHMSVDEEGILVNMAILMTNSG